MRSHLPCTLFCQRSSWAPSKRAFRCRIFGFSLLTGGYPCEHVPSSSKRTVASLEAEGSFPFHWSKRNCAVLRQRLVSLRREGGGVGDGLGTLTLRPWCTPREQVVFTSSRCVELLWLSHVHNDRDKHLFFGALHQHGWAGISSSLRTNLS